MFKRKNDKTEENVKDNELKENTKNIDDKSIDNSVESKDAEQINYKKEIIKLVTISGHLNKVQMLAIRAYLKKTTEEEQKDMYEKIQEEGLDAIINKFKSANVVKTQVK